MTRPKIPADIRREVRQRCGFGCVLCGCPIYEVDHIVQYSVTQSHDIGNLTLLCDFHHKRKGLGLLPLADVIKANEDPFNKRSGITKAESLSYSGTSVELCAGGDAFSYENLTEGYTFFPFVIDGHPVVSFTIRDRQLLLNAEFHTREGDICFQIVENELTINANQWDVEWVGNGFTVRDGARDILLEIEFSPPSRVSIKRADLRYNGVEIEIGSGYIFCLNNCNLFTAPSSAGFPCGFAIGSAMPGVRTGILMDVPRYGFDRDDAKRYLKQRLSLMRDRAPSAGTQRPPTITLKWERFFLPSVRGFLSFSVSYLVRFV